MPRRTRRSGSSRRSSTFYRRLPLLAVLALLVIAGALAYGLVSDSASATGTFARRSVAANLDPGLVDITVTFGQQNGYGAATGMVLTSSGEVVTNNHVVDGATTITVHDLGNGRRYSATVVGYSPSQDVALLQLQDASGLRTVPLGNSNTVPIGRPVFAVGNAGGRGGTPSITAGRIVARGRSIVASDMGGANAQRLSGLLETNALVIPGDSGGALVDRRTGRVIGMNAAASVSTQFQSAVHQGYAIPINRALAIVRMIERGQASATIHIGPTAQLGVGLATLDPYAVTMPDGSTRTGAAIGAVLSGSPAEGAGLQAGDVVVEVAGQPVASGRRLRAVLLTHHPGESAVVRWIDQAGALQSATVQLASGPPA